jgi:hypothetical protein
MVLCCSGHCFGTYCDDSFMCSDLSDGFVGPHCQNVQLCCSMLNFSGTCLLGQGCQCDRCWHVMWTDMVFVPVVHHLDQYAQIGMQCTIQKLVSPNKTRSS